MQKQVINWLKAQVKAAKAKGVVLGLSGGLDSCVCAVLAKKALGRKNVLGASNAMPQPKARFT